MGGADELFGGEQAAQTSGADLLFGGESAPTTGADDLFSGEEQQRENSLKFIADETVNETPERASRSIEIMNRTGIPKKFIDDNFDELDKAAKQSEFDAREFIQSSPKVADWMLKNPDYATLIKEDREAMAAMEKIITTEAKYRKFGEWKPEEQSSFGKIVDPFLRGAARGRQATTLLFSELGLYKADNVELAVRLADQQRRIERFPAAAGAEAGLGEIQAAKGFGDALSAILRNPHAIYEVSAESLGLGVPVLAAAAVGSGAGPAGTAVGAGTGSFVIEYASTIAESLAESGISMTDPVSVGLALQNKELMAKAREKAVKRGIIIGAFDALTAGFAGRLLATAKPGVVSKTTRVIGEGSLQAVGGAAGEAGAQFATGEFKPGEILLEAFSEIPTALIEVPANVAAMNRNLKNKSKLQEEFFKALGDNSTDSKLRERLPDSYQEIVKELAIDIHDVYLPFELFQSHFQEQGIDPRQLAQEIGIKRQYDEAINTADRKIAIPTDVYARYIAHTEHNTFFAKDLSLEGQMSSRETDEFLKESEKEKEPETDAFGESLMQAMTPIREQLKAIYPADVADKNAAVIEARLRSRATRLGVDPQELMKQRPLEITEGGESTGAELMQKQTETPEFKKLSALLGSASVARDMIAVSNKSAVDSLQRHSESLTDLLERGSSGAHGDRSTQVPSAVVTQVLGVTENQQILRAIIRALPVDVMDFFGRKQIAPESFLRDKTMLKNMLSGDSKAAISFDINESVATSLVQSIARTSAEIASLTKRPLEGDTTGAAGASDSVLGAHGRNDITKTASFQAWFGESKVVDESGKPLVVYHGTTNDFEEFSVTSDIGFHFGTFSASNVAAKFQGGITLSGLNFNNDSNNRIISDNDTSETEIEDSNILDKNGIGIGLTNARLIPVYLSLKKPLYTVDAGQWYELTETKTVIQNAKDKEGEYVFDNDEEREIVFSNSFDEIRDFLDNKGYDGIVYKNTHEGIGGELSYIVFKAKQIKSAIGNRGTFDPNDPNILFQAEAGKPFYSAVLAATEALPQSKGTPEQMFAQIKKTPGVKQEELEWIGLEEWIKQQGKSVTKEQIADFIRANQVDVREATLGDNPEPMRKAREMAEADGNDWDSLGVANQARYRQRAAGEPITKTVAGETKFASYQLPGGENYRELLLTLPPQTEGMRAFYFFRERMIQKYGPGHTADKYTDAEEAERIKLAKSVGEKEFNSPHFSEPNVIAHVRFNERTDADGKRVLFIEEVQSDWHQKGRKQGYGSDTSAIQKEQDAYEKTLVEKYGTEAWRPKADTLEKAYWDELSQKIRDGEGGVPEAPFKTTWPLLAMKRMIRYAAENGFDRVAWTTGEQQAARYDLSLQVSEVEAFKRPSGKVDLKVTGKNGENVMMRDALTPNEVADTIGKDLADKIAAGANGKQTYSGLDLKVGGTGMKAFYDQMLPSMVNKYVKKWGGKVGETQIDAEKISSTQRGDDARAERLQRTLKGGSVASIPVHSLDITDAMRESVMQGQPLFQEGKDTKRGSISVSPTGDVIRLFKAKNLSTLLHELSHRWLFEMQDDAALQNAPQQIKDDLAATLKYLGVESVEELDITKIPKGTAAYAKAVAANEKFAETGEAYLMEGKAPSAALRRVFAQIRAWLVAVYKALKQGRLDVELTPEMRGVFDRLLATDEEIAQAKVEANAVPIFTTSVDAGMSDTEFTAYRKTIEDANREEREELDAKVMNQYKKTLTDIWKEEKAKVQVEVEAELDVDPVYAAMAKMKENAIKIARSEAGSLPKSLTAKDGIPADMAAEMLGFTSGEAMVKALAFVEPRGARSSRETNNRMDKQFGNLLTDGKLVEEARKAVMGDGRAKIIEAEIKALNKKAREVKPFVKAKEKAEAEQARAGRDLYNALVPKLANVREHVATVIAGKPIRELRPMQYYNAARQASREAINDVRKKDYLMAGYNKGRELLNLELYREANNAIDSVEKNRKYLQKFDKDSSRKKMRGEFLAQIDDILDRFDLRKRSGKAIDAEKQSLVDFVEKESERLSAIVPDIAPVILNERYRKNYKEMTVEELTGVVAAVKQLEALARREHEQYMAIRQMNFEQERTSIIDRLREFNPDKFDKEGNPKPIEPVFVPNVSDAAKKLGDKFSGEFLNTETILNLLEGGSFGQVEQSLFGRMSERSDWKATRLEGIYKKLKPLFDQYSFLEKRSFARKDIGIGMTRENAVVVALLNGNKEGRERLNNYGWSEAKIHQIISHLDQKDFNLVNGFWDVFDQDLWPELRSLNERTRGSAPPKVEAVPYQTRFGEQKGGYFKLIYDTELDERAHSFDETKAVKDLLGGSMGISAKTSQGSSTARKDGVKLRPRLDLNVFSEAVNETVHDLSYREAVADSMKLLNDPDIRDSIKSIAGTPAYRALVTRVRETAAPPRNPSGFIEKALTIARKNTIVTLLSGVRTALLNVTGAVSVYTRSFEKASPVSAGLLTREYGKFFSPRMQEMYEFCINNSEYMRHRFNNFDRDLQDQTNKLTVNGKILPDTGQWLWLMKMTDRAVTVPAWNASFAEGMKRYSNDIKQASEYANHIVRQTQGSGRDVDLAKIMSGHGGWGQLKKVFTMFQSFFNGQLGQLVRAGAISTREAQDNRADAIAKFTARFILIVSIPAAIATIGGRDDDDMDDNWFKKFAYVNIMYIAAMFPLVRDLASYAWSKFDKSVANYGLKLSPVQAAGEGVVKGVVATTDIVKGEGTKKDVKDVIMGTSFTLGLPGKLISDVVLGTNAYLEGDKGPEAVFFGPGIIRE